MICSRENTLKVPTLHLRGEYQALHVLWDFMKLSLNKEMNQRISVRAIIEQDSRTLIVRRAIGRETILGLYELPGGKLAYGEQPEDALRRCLHDDESLHISDATLFDVVTYIDYDDRNIQYAVITYKVVLTDDHHDLKLSDKYDMYMWQKMSDIQQNTITDLTKLLLGIIQQEKLTDESIENITNNDVKISPYEEAIIYTDGGSRGNPGPSASGYLIMNNEQKVILQGGEYLGITTNNQAEYHGVRIGLEKALELRMKKINFRSDSMLVVNQMKGLYTIKNRELWPINERIRDLVTQFDSVTFQYVPREQNQLADSEVNRVLDKHANEINHV